MLECQVVTPTSASNSRTALLALIADGLVARFGFGLITFALPFYGLELGMSYAEIGVLAALRPLTAVGLKPLMGRLTDVIGQRRMYIGAIVGRCIVAALFVVASQVWILFVIRFLHGATSAARDPAAALLISTYGGKKKLATAFAWYGSAREVGAALGIVCAGVMLTASDDFYPLVFLAAAVISLVGLILSMLYIPRTSHHDDTGDHPSPLDSRADGTPNSEWVVYAILGIAMATTGAMLVQLFPVLAVDYAGLTKAQTSYIFALSLLVAVFAAPWFGHLADRFSRHLVLSLRAALNIISTAIYWLAPSFGGFVAGRVCDDLGKAAFRPAWGAMTAEIAESNKSTRGRTLGYMDTAQSAGEALGPVLAGWLWDEFGIATLFAARIGLSVAAEAYAVWVAQRKVRRNS